MHLLLLEALSLEVAEVEVVEYLQLELDKQVEVMQLQMDQVLMVVREVLTLVVVEVEVQDTLIHQMVVKVAQV